LRPSRGRLSEGIIAALCLAGGVFFFASLAELWPLLDVDLTASRARLSDDAARFLRTAGFDLEGYRSAVRLAVDTGTLDYVEREFGRGRAQEWVRGGWPLVQYRVAFKKRGETIWYAVALQPSGSVSGWSKFIQEDYPAGRIPEERARGLAQAALATGLGLDPTGLDEKSLSTAERIGHRIHTLGFERTLSETPELRERVTITLAGEEVVAASRQLLVPEAARRQARSREAPAVALETTGFLLVAVAAIVAFFIFLAGVRDGTARVARAALWPALVFLCLMATFMLQTAELFAFWEPLWSRWVSDFRYFVLSAAEQTWLVLLLLALVAAGDVLDGRSGGVRGAALHALGRGRIFDPLVACAAWRGFLVGLLCGGVLALGVTVVQALAGGLTSLQPRGFFFYTLNSASPAAASVLFFFGVALAEELGYRYFGANWILALTGRRWLAVVVPALLYGLTHAQLDFLPPAEPFWGRAGVLTLVGCVWGWAFLRYDALTVVLSHFTADLFIFNWPRLAGGEAAAIGAALLALCVPLIPVLGLLPWPVGGRPRLPS